MHLEQRIYLSNILHLTAVWFRSSGSFKFKLCNKCTPSLCFYHLYHLTKVAVTQRKLKRKVMWWTLEMEFICDDGGPEARASSPACLLFTVFIFLGWIQSCSHIYGWGRIVIVHSNSTSLSSDDFFKIII